MKGIHVKTRKVLAAAVAAALVLSSAACATRDDAAADEGEIVVGLVAPTSGYAADYGPEAAQGVELALAKSGDDVRGKKITIVKVNEDVLDPSQTLERVKKLIETDGADIVLGPTFGSSQQAVSAYLDQQDVPMFTMLGGDAALAGDEGSGFLWPAADKETAGPLGTYAAEELGFDKIATLGPDYAYGQNAIAGAVEAFEEAGGEVAQQQWVPLGTTDMLQYATKLDESVDAVVMWLVPNDAASFVREYRNLGIDVPLLMFQGVFDPTYQAVGGQLLGEIGLNEYNHLLKNPENEAFTSAYASEYGGIPNQTTAFAYAVTNIILAGLEETGGDPAVDAMRSALDGKELDTVIGPAVYDEDGMAASNRTVVKSVKAGDRYEWKPITTYENVGH